MDPICHTLVGAALSESGLRRRSRLGAATLLVGANLPDIDVVSLVGGPVAPLVMRRGWTHGVLAVVVLPVVLAAIMKGWDRLRPPRVGDAADWWQLVVLASVAVATHPLLDFLNVYGMRWLMPFVDRWYYGDVLFIVDPWAWVILAGGVFLARRRWRDRRTGWERPARWGIATFGAYVGFMTVLAVWARGVVAGELARAGSEDARFMVAPVPVTPFRRLVVIDRHDGRYQFGAVRWSPMPTFTLEPYSVLRRGDEPAARRAAATVDGQGFLRWARFPFFLIERSRGAVTVHIVDARYTVDPDASFGAVSMVVSDEP